MRTDILRSSSEEINAFMCIYTPAYTCIHTGTCPGFFSLLLLWITDTTKPYFIPLENKCLDLNASGSLQNSVLLVFESFRKMMEKFLTISASQLINVRRNIMLSHKANDNVFMMVAAVFL